MRIDRSNRSEQAMPQADDSTKDKRTKADKTRARIIQVATRLVKEDGSDRVTLRRIAAAAKMKAGSIYYHFDSRDEIIRAVLEGGVGGARKAVMQAIEEAGPTSSPLVRLSAALRAHLAYTLQEHFSSRLKAIRRLPKRLRDHHMKQEREYDAIFADLLDEGQRKGLLRPGFNLSVVRMLSTGALTWVAEWYKPDGPLSPDEIADEFIRLLAEGMVKPGFGPIK
jgi:TetR/AcrR family transcriptional regulator, cholesterol catabolism regulator